MFFILALNKLAFWDSSDISITNGSSLYQSSMNQFSQHQDPTFRLRSRLLSLSSITLNSPVRTYCNFIEDMAIGDEKSFVNHQDYNLTLSKIILLIRHGHRGPIRKIQSLDKISCDLVRNDVDRVIFETMNLMRKFDDLKQKFSKYPENNDIYYQFPDSKCSVGILTRIGLAQHINLGSILFRHYKDWLNFDSNRSKFFDNIKIFTTEYQRTVQSALAFLQGFYCFENKLNPFDLVDKFHFDSDHFFCHIKNHCLHNETIKEIYRKANLTMTIESNHSFFDEMIRIRSVLFGNEETLNTSHHLISVFDALAASYVCHKEPLPCDAKNFVGQSSPECLSINQVEKIYSLFTDHMDDLNRQKNYIKLTRKISYGFIQNLISIIEENSPAKLFLFSGHDITIQALSSALGFYDEYLPRLASRVIFEVYTTDQNKKYFRVIYNGDDVTDRLDVCNLDADESVSLEFPNESLSYSEKRCKRFGLDHILVDFGSFKRYVSTNYFTEKF